MRRAWLALSALAAGLLSATSSCESDDVPSLTARVVPPVDEPRLVAQFEVKLAGLDEVITHRFLRTPSGYLLKEHVRAMDHKRSCERCTRPIESQGASDSER